jgi:hypothetical protein
LIYKEIRLLPKKKELVKNTAKWLVISPAVVVLVCFTQRIADLQIRQAA